MKKILMLAPAMCMVLFCFAQDIGSKIDTLVSAYAKLYRFNGSVLVAKGGTKC